MRRARKTIHLGTQSFEQYVRQEKQILQKLTGEIGQSGQNDVEAFKEAINKLRKNPLALPVAPIVDSYLTIESRKRLGNLKIDIERKLSEKESEIEKGNSAASIEVAIEDLTKDKQAILEVGMRNARCGIRNEGFRIRDSKSNINKISNIIYIKCYVEC